MAIEHFLMETHTHIHAITHKSIFIDSIDVRLFVICLHSVSPVVSLFSFVLLFRFYFYFLFIFIVIAIAIAIVIIMNHHHLIMLKLSSYSSFIRSVPFHCVVVITFFLSFAYVHSSNPFHSVPIQSNMQFIFAIPHSYIHSHTLRIRTAYIVCL